MIADRARVWVVINHLAAPPAAQAAFTHVDDGRAWLKDSGRVDRIVGIQTDDGGWLWCRPDSVFGNPGDWDVVWSLTRVPLDPPD